MWSLAIAAALASHGGPAAEGVLHRGTVQAHTVAWESTWRTHARCVPLAAPFEAPFPFTTEDRDGAPWLCRPPDTGWHLRYERPFPSDDMALPLLADTLQRVEVSGARFESTDGGVTKHLKVWSSPGITRRDRKLLDRSLPRTTAATRLYLAPRRGQVIAGTLRRPGASPTVLYGTLGAFLAIGATLALAYRVLERGARRERFERWLHERDDASPDDGPAPMT